MVTASPVSATPIVMRWDEDVEMCVEAIHTAPRHTITLDLETTGLDPHTEELRAIGIGAGERVFISQVPSTRHLDLLRPALEDPDLWVVGHNLSFDYKWLLGKCRIRLAQPLCTYVTEKVLTAGLRLPGSLDALEERYLGVRRDYDKKALQKSFIGQRGPLTPQQLQYLAEDCQHLLPILHQQMKRIHQEGLLPVLEVEMRLLPYVAEMELLGMAINWPAWERHNAEVQARLEEQQDLLDELLKPDPYQTALAAFKPLPHVNLNSVVQLRGALMALGLSVTEKLDVKAIMILQRQAEEQLGRESKAYRALQALRAFRKLEKQRSTYGTEFVNKRNALTDMLHPNIHQVGGEATGRLSSSGPNSMNIPSRGEASVVRDFFVPEPPGYESLRLLFPNYVSDKERIVITADYSQQELRVLAEESQDPSLLDAFQQERDLHINAASLIFKQDYDRMLKLIEEADALQAEGKPLTAEHKRAKDLRSAAKTLQFGLIYGMGATKLSNDLTDAGMPTSFVEARQMLSKYFRVMPGVAEWLNRKRKEARHYLQSQTLSGRRRYFTAPAEGSDTAAQWASIEREGGNQPIQGLSADITKLAVVLVSEVIRPYQGRVVNIVHDELVITCPKAEQDRVAALVREEMLAAARHYLKTVPVEVGVKVGEHWLK